VNRYRNDMRAGRWSFTAEPIQFDKAGHLINGQHRMAALASLPATANIMFLVVRGLDIEAQMAMDQGRFRTAGTQLTMQGIKDGNVVAAGVRMYVEYKDGFLFRDNKAAAENVTTNVIERYVADHSDVIAFMSKFIGDIKANDAPASVAYAAALIFAHRDADGAREFFHLMSHGAGTDHPITVLDKRLQRHRREGIAISRRDELGLFIQAWNAWRKGHTLTRFQRARGGSWTETNFPRVAS
jgi:hypothetical protein